MTDPQREMSEEVEPEGLTLSEHIFQEWERRIRREEFEKGFKEGFQKAVREAACQEGQIQGMQKITLSVLRQRFGPVPQVARQRVKEISSTRELQRLFRRILSADSLQETGLV